MTEIETFIRAMLDEDEAAAIAAEEQHGPAWSVATWGSKDYWRAVVTGKSPSPTSGLGAAGDLWETEGALGTTVQAAEHMARHCPGRVLDEIKTKRRLLEWLEATERDFHACEGIASNVRLMRREMASSYAGRAGYDPAWRP